MSQAGPPDRGAAKRLIDRSASARSKSAADGIVGQIAAIGRRLAELKAGQADLQTARAALERELAAIAQASHSAAFAMATVTGRSPSSAKVELFRSLFKGRTDDFPVRWQNSKTGKGGYSPACANEWARGICAKPQVKCGQCPHQAFVPLSDDIIARHLRGGSPGSGNCVAGVYPLLVDGTCWFLAADFDKQDWVAERRPEIGNASYDRFFPNQDTMPLGGFGNLIALPLQRRARDAGNSVFVDESLRPYDDQWAFL